MEVDTKTVEDRESETETDKIWVSMSHLKFNTETVRNRKAETEADIFRDHPSQPEGDHEKVENMNRNT